MGNAKEIAKTAAIVVGVLYAYHTGILNFIPAFAEPKKAGKS